MGNKIFQSILDEKIEAFRYSFEKTAIESYWDEQSQELIHPGEYGTYRETVTKDFLRLLVPTRLDIGSGFLITDRGEVSTQCDIIIFDRNNTPLIENAERQKFYPIETACAIGEVKSDLNKTEFKKAINKLARNKTLRQSITSPTIIKRDKKGAFDPVNYPYDHVFSFLICNKLNFKIGTLHNEIDQMYDDDIKPWQKHNLVLSINDGLIAYYDKNEKTMMYPYISKSQLKNRIVIPNTNRNCHFHFASSYIFMGTSSSSIYYPEITNYITKFLGGVNLNQE